MLAGGRTRTRVADVARPAGMGRQAGAPPEKDARDIAHLVDRLLPAPDGGPFPDLPGGSA